MSKMRFAVNLPGGYLLPENRRLMLQLGCTDVIGHGPRDSLSGASRATSASEVWEYSDIVHDKMQVERDGLTFEVLEDAPDAEKIFWNLPGKEEQLENFCKSLVNLGNAGIKVVKVQHMPPVRQMIPRTYVAKPTRGGATSTAFDYDDIKNAPPTSKYGTYTEEEVWENIEYFLKRVLPTAEKAGVVVTFHPDDPPISPIQGFPRPLRSVAAFDRLLGIVPSENIGLNFCQGCFAEMGEDVPAAIRHFGRKKKIFFAHFRNVIGSVKEPGGFQESFHDDPKGRVDMFQAMKAFYEIGFEGPMRPDHAPTMEYDNRIGGGSPGYQLLGKVFAMGYVKALAESVEKTGY
ncbi:MAG: mannonate dehydratase [Sedimentisphaerales bacterium]|nr:mannonate dehydratase [Sedimentisphaerales bacterium]